MFSGQPFDPFNHRLSRDIRNSLAEAFADALQAADPLCYQQTVDQWLAKELTDALAGYVRDRMKRYDAVIKRVRKHSIVDAGSQALVSWNHELFFEVHELLERIWLKTNGDEHQALKGLIQAAGVYVHLEFNNRSAAEKLAGKAADRIRTYADCLPFIGNLDSLLQSLNNLDRRPPRLTGSY